MSRVYDEMNVARRRRINRYMRLTQNLYLMATIIVASLFTTLFIVSVVGEGESLWFCFIPVALVIFDFVKSRTERLNRIPELQSIGRAIRHGPPRPRPVPATRYSSSGGVIGSTSIGVIEFISEEEFKV